MTGDRVQRVLIAESTLFFYDKVREHLLRETYEKDIPAWDDLTFGEQKVMKRAMQDLMIRFALIAHTVDL